MDTASDFRVIGVKLFVVNGFRREVRNDPVFGGEFRNRSTYRTVRTATHRDVMSHNNMMPSWKFCFRPSDEIYEQGAPFSSLVLLLWTQSTMKRLSFIKEETSNSTS